MADLDYGYDSSSYENEPEYDVQTYESKEEEKDGPGFSEGVATGLGIGALVFLAYKGIRRLFGKDKHHHHHRAYRKDDIIDGEYREVVDDEPADEEAKEATEE